MSENKEELHNEKLNAALMCYTFVQKEKDLDDNLQELHDFLRVSGFGQININDLQEKINKIKKEEKKVIHNQRVIAELFTEDKKTSIYRFGSDFCPNCYMFKNYKKECPYCNYLEMTI